MLFCVKIRRGAYRQTDICFLYIRRFNLIIIFYYFLISIKILAFFSYLKQYFNHVFLNNLKYLNMFYSFCLYNFVECFFLLLKEKRILKVKEIVFDIL